MAENKWSQEIQAKVIAHAWKDENYRKLLTNNPKEALKEFGIEIPSNVEMKVMQEDLKHFYFVLPPCPSNLDELSDSELGKLAAGIDMHASYLQDCSAGAQSV